MQLVHRADIDGLRAIAILSVVAYHLSRDWVPCGYLGVDIFFVISGYLIGSIVYKEVLEGNFSFSNFYLRRVRRIAPAMLFVLIAVSVFGILLFLPADLMGLGRSIVATVALIPNIYFWRDTDYFSRVAEEKPLLHLWSLGVEEQFYLLLPPLIVLVVKYARNRLTIILLFVLVVSYAANVMLIMVGGASPAFFLSPSRAWELVVGVLLSLRTSRVQLKHHVSLLIGGIGGILVFASLLHWWNLPLQLPASTLAVIGAALLIYAGARGETPWGFLLSSTPMVWIGKVSYSLYLWHWPLIVFAQYWLIRDLTFFERVLVFCTSILLASMSWRWIEEPCRSGKPHPKKVLQFVGSAWICLTAIAAVLVLYDGLPARVSASATAVNASVGTHYRCPLQTYLAFGSSRACALYLPSGELKKARVVLLGNSHAQMYAPLVKEILTREKVEGILVPLNSCLPLVSVNISSDCLAAAQRNLDAVLTELRPGLVIIGFDWNVDIKNLIRNSNQPEPDANSDQVLFQGIENLILRINAAGVQVALIGPVMTPGWDVASVLSRQLQFGRNNNIPLERPAVDFETRFVAMLNLLEKQSKLVLIRPDSVQCNSDKCQFVIDGHSIFADSNHLASTELFRFATLFNSALLPVVNSIK